MKQSCVNHAGSSICTKDAEVYPELKPVVGALNMKQP